MKNLLCSITLACTFFLNTAHLGAAPIPPAGPFDIVGTISEVKWVPEQYIPGKPGWSGSLGHDRVVLAHFVVRLVKYKGVSAENAVRVTRYITYNAYGDKNPSCLPPFIILKINSKNKNFLKTGMKLRIKGYSVRGDEGGTWTSFTGISTH
jgi:hypothetical protein